MKCDFHVHTWHSDDSQTPMETMTRRAIELGLEEICFTDHIDYGVKWDDGPKERRNCLCEPYFEELYAIQRKYENEIVIRAGMEFGIQPETAPMFQKTYDSWKFDFIILSCHQANNREFWNQDFQQGKTQAEIHEAYYSNILASMHCFHDYSVLGHLDMIKRYDPYGDYPDERVLPMVEEILRLAILQGKGIEVNTSCFRYGLKDLTPSRAILRLYRALGGEILSMGSDAHKPADLAAYIEATKPVLRDLGFRYFCTFDKMKPIFHKL
ncbi:MAG: histidinol-phosphatase HisJ family protein [Clostridia bacterium]|nr:histidinol-phosphatase HisJ family protein [Clostridia bacterium]